MLLVGLLQLLLIVLKLNIVFKYEYKVFDDLEVYQKYYRKVNLLY